MIGASIFDEAKSYVCVPSMLHREPFAGRGPFDLAYQRASSCDAGCAEFHSLAHFCELSLDERAYWRPESLTWSPDCATHTMSQQKQLGLIVRGT